MNPHQNPSVSIVDTVFFQNRSSLKLQNKSSLKLIEKVPLAVMILLLIDIGLFSSYLTNYMIGKPFQQLTILLNLDGECSIAAWYSNIKFFCISAFGGLFAYRYVSWNDRSSWALLGLPFLFLFFSMDGAVLIHEWLGFRTDILLPGGRREASIFHYTGIWMFTIGIPFLIFFLLFAYSIRKYFSAKTGSFKKVVFGMIILLIGALGFEALSNFTLGKHSFGYLLMVCCEETFEMVGGTIIFWGLYDLTKDFITIKES